MSKLRIRYAKRGRLRFTSHRDLARAFERALRRAGIPVAHSQGFSPHPKISWAGAVPTGAASEAEYVEVQLVERVDPELVRARLDAALPAGFDLVEAVEADSGTLSDRLEVSRWRIELPEVSVLDLRAAVARLMAAETAEVERMTKNGRRTFDARAAVVHVEAHEHTSARAELYGPNVDTVSNQQSHCDARVDDWPKDREPYGILVAVVRQATPVVRPDDVLSALRVVADLAPPAFATATRTEQGRLDDSGGLADPLAQDRAAAGARRGEPAAG
ncbi:TIGR03936 family radical SAM-associated protein [Haloactinomyces albus]|uniref:TIGR03936 family radical SAM-associated protein n=1 Tax=Haloactinomyces albus TaxID=1352928 RepID=UPI0035B51639